MPRREDVIAMLKLAGPVVVVQVGLMMMGVVDIMVVGRVSATALAAVALGHVAVMSVVSLGMGLLMVVDPLVSQAIGARDRLAVRRTFQRCLLMAVLIAVPVILVLIPVEPVLAFLRQPEETVPIAAGYVHRVLPGLIPFFGFIVLRQTLQAMERMRPIVLTIVFANGLNLVLDLALVHGMWGFPALGPFGSAWATSLSRLTLFVGLGLAAHRVLLPLVTRLDREAFRIAPLVRTFKLGLPIGIQLLLEFTSVSAIALLMGGMGAIAMAAHQVSINLAALAFMVPLGLSAASAVRVGHAVGRDDLPSARRSTTAALLCGFGFILVIAALFLSIPRVLASAYTPEVEVLDIAATLVPIAGIFLVFDAFQIIAAGVLRGMGDTRAPMLIVLFGFWIIGIPVSVVLAFHLGFGPQGLWWGFVAGLAVVAPLLMLRIAAKLSRPLVRVSVD
jgi:MATE family multidrug resistance protein